MAKRESQPINAGSMADIAFLLLIFFLVTTTMDVDTGLMRRLPPIPDEDQQDTDDKIKERNVFVVLINKNNDLLVENEEMSIYDLRERAMEFIANPDDREDLPEKDYKEIEFFGNVYVPKNPVISLRNDRGTAYGTYLMVQNELLAAKNELRDQLSMQTFGKKYKNLEEEEEKAVQQYYTSVLSEAEPKNIGGNK
ncbi:MAG: biopolymer transporter ExbD [Bacteroidales bacterium]|nr:biopolymer transporter ExbD [Bacteroidales bacterium]